MKKCIVNHLHSNDGSMNSHYELFDVHKEYQDECYLPTPLLKKLKIFEYSDHPCKFLAMAKIS